MNRLGGETSPYLRQHAGNPVDWHPWGAEALALAKQSGKPILLSIGYSACHWCHVMAHESFEDAATAQLMNTLFVNIKVDREERPDLDRLYQSAHYLIAQRPGGWPLTMFLTHDEQVPFFGGTYFPDEPRYGMPAFRDVIQRVATFYATHADSVRGQAGALREALRQLEPGAAQGGALDRRPLAAFRQIAAERADREAGGFGGAPKFPQPALLERLLRHWHGTAHDETPDREALYLVALSLSRMASGGLRDHVSGGFYRYSVDRHWGIPHFEKMLYDNGALLALYAAFHGITGDGDYREVAEDIAGWALDEMRLEGGGFCASLDADSEGAEGRHYLWTPDAVRAVLEADDCALVSRHYGLDGPANFEDPHHGSQAWHLRICQPVDALAREMAQPVSTVRRRLNAARDALYRARSARTRPARDDKVLTGWNAMMIRGLAIAGRVLDRPDLTDAAAQTADFIAAQMTIDGRLHATWAGGRARFHAWLDDHAFLLDALLELLQSRWSTRHFNQAVATAEQLLALFEDRDDGGFYFTPHDHEVLLHRQRPLADESLPSGNGIAAFALARLGHLVSEPRYLRSAERTLRIAWPALLEQPLAHPSLLNALEAHLAPPDIIIIRGDGAEAEAWARLARGAWHPRRLVYAIPVDAGPLPVALAARQARSDAPIAYLCRGAHCEPPIDSATALAAALADNERPGGQP